MIPDIIVNGGNITVRPIRDNNNIDVRMRNVRDIINTTNINIANINAVNVDFRYHF